jgi:hypothetical protein
LPEIDEINPEEKETNTKKTFSIKRKSENMTAFTADRSLKFMQQR